MNKFDKFLLCRPDKIWLSNVVDKKKNKYNDKIHYDDLCSDCKKRLVRYKKVDCILKYDDTKDICPFIADNTRKFSLSECCDKHLTEIVSEYRPFISKSENSEILCRKCGGEHS